MSMAIAAARPPIDTLAGIDIPAGKPAEIPHESFSKLVDQFLSHTQGKMDKADQAVIDLATGKTENLHNVMLAVAEADLSFRMALEIRNRLTDAYQEVMRMQV